MKHETHRCFLRFHKGARPEYSEAAVRLGELLAREKIELVYGGGMVGLMGIVADAALKNGGHVIGVIPQSLVIKEVVHEKLPDLRVVKNMHERKALIAELSDAFIGARRLRHVRGILRGARVGPAWLSPKPFGLLGAGGFYAGCWSCSTTPPAKSSSGPSTENW